MRAIAIDFETANENRASACAVGLAWIEDGAVTRRAYRLIRPPEMRFNPGNVRIHGIGPADVHCAGAFPDVMAEFMGDMTGTLLIAHNAAFDMGVIGAALTMYGRPVPRLRYLCTRVIAQRSWPGEPSFGLAAMAALIGVRFRHHHAEEDAAACAEVALAAARRRGTTRIATLADDLALAPRILTPPVSRRVDVRVTPSPRSRFLAQDPLVFRVRGRTGNSYAITCDHGGDLYHLRCTCLAGQNRRRCRHVTALLDGEIDDLVSDNLYDLAKLKVIVDAVGQHAVRPVERRSKASLQVQPVQTGLAAGG